MNTKAIIFDLDGVITDSAKYHFEAWKELADRLGYKFDEDDNERLKGVSRLDSLNIILEINNALDAFTLEEKEAMCTEKNDNYVKLIAKVTPEDILPGIAKFMADAKAAGLKLAVASVSKNAPALLTSLGIIDEFDYIADARKISKSKPDPEIFTVCAESLGIAPENCVGVEDSQAGIEAINAAGMKSIGINVTVTSITPDLPLKSTAELDFATMID
jgi:beta-phosphoglucomutase